MTWVAAVIEDCSLFPGTGCIETEEVSVLAEVGATEVSEFCAPNRSVWRAMAAFLAANSASVARFASCCSVRVASAIRVSSSSSESS